MDGEVKTACVALLESQRPAPKNPVVVNPEPPAPGGDPAKAPGKDVGTKPAEKTRVQGERQQGQHGRESPCPRSGTKDPPHVGRTINVKARACIAHERCCLLPWRTIDGLDPIPWTV